jgi:hypothetical protein
MIWRKFGPDVHRDEVVVEDPTSQPAKTFGLEKGSGEVGLRIGGTQHSYALGTS